MQNCSTGYFELAIPDGWEDRTMVTWVAPPSPRYKVLPNILVSKSKMLPMEDLSGFVNRQLKELMAKVRTFDLLRRGEANVSGQPALELVFSMKPQGVVLMQRQLFFNPPRDPRTVHTVVATSAKDDWPNLEKDFAQIFNSLTMTD
ncbi:DcrB-related protein [Paracoccus sp. (in: a-proteobacteria)]|uniref:DcrB-related protein n=1 Tax=Paracoccus sp. TaxID=267 RepID=UPI002896CFCD|nr:DcrB-related protein [Paracoccus sp. (in: a-proteobacteria)]